MTDLRKSRRSRRLTREEALREGLCTTCRRRKPPTGRKTCLSCNRYSTDPKVRERTKKRAKEDHHRRHAKALDYYGRACADCGATEDLQIDHVPNDGALHRALQPNSRNLAWWLEKNGYPEGFQTLCRTCNLKKPRPIKRKRTDSVASTT